ncbi:E3 ubiquitin-protein ligase Mdm2 [Gryllus bimaculatus]|nr:E3 ubiquitin-protein ligase Mdm2 [Gryllus bimaculatus]
MKTAKVHIAFNRRGPEMLYTATAATVLMAAHLREDRDLWADSSSSNLDSSDSEVPLADYWECVRCKRKCTPLTRYCVKCFQLRKGYFPERPKRTHPRRRKRAASSRPGTALADPPRNVVDLEQAQSSGSQSAEEQPVGKLEKGDSGISLGVSDEQLAPECASSSQSSSLVQLRSQDSAPPEDADRESLSPRSELCFMCVNRPKDGAFIHSKSVHVLCCYQCALKVWNETKKCPMCNNRPHNVLKLVFG